MRPVRRDVSGRRRVDRATRVAAPMTYLLLQNTYCSIRFCIVPRCLDAISPARSMRPHFTCRSRSFCVKQHEESGATHCLAMVYEDTPFFGNVSRACRFTSPRIAKHMNSPPIEGSCGEAACVTRCQCSHPADHSLTQPTRNICSLPSPSLLQRCAWIRLIYWGHINYPRIPTGCRAEIKSSRRSRMPSDGAGRRAQSNGVQFTHPSRLE